MDKVNCIGFDFIKYIYTDSKTYLDGFDLYNEFHKKYFECKRNSVPSKLYRYSKFSRNSVDAINRNQIWVSNPKYFNDPYEGIVEFDSHAYERKKLVIDARRDGKVGENSYDSLTESELLVLNHLKTDHFYTWSKEYEIYNRKGNMLKEYIENKKWEYTKQLIDIEKNILKKPFYIASFSEQSNNPPMWAHYADNYKGFCVEYDLSELRKSNFDDDKETFLINRLFQVQYTSKIQRIAQSHLRTSNSQTSRIAIKRKLIRAILTKSRHWAYEKEWRLVVSNSRRKGYLLQFPYATKITCGFNMKDEHIKEVNKVCVANNIELKVKHKSLFSNYIYELSYDKYLEEKEFVKTRKQYKKIQRKFKIDDVK